LPEKKLSGKNRVHYLEKRIFELKRRWPAHSVPPAMMQELDELEEMLKEARSRQESEQDHAQTDNCG
jgi:hypothetical protein